MRLTIAFFAVFALAMPAVAQQGAKPEPPSTLRAPTPREENEVREPIPVWDSRWSPALDKERF